MTDEQIDARAAEIHAEVKRMAESARRSNGQRARYGLAAVRRVTVPALARTRRDGLIFPESHPALFPDL